MSVGQKGSPEGRRWCWAGRGDIPAGALVQAGTWQCVRGATRSAGAWMHPLRPHDLHRREVTETTQPTQSVKQGKAGWDTRPVPDPQAFPYFRTVVSKACRLRIPWEVLEPHGADTEPHGWARVSWQEPRGCRMLGADSPWPAQAPQRPPSPVAGMAHCTCGARIRSHSREISPSPDSTLPPPAPWDSWSPGPRHHGGALDALRL